MVQELSEEDSRAVKEGLDEESLAIFDLLRKSELKPADIKSIKNVAVGLLGELKGQIENINQWRQRESSRDAVRTTIHDYLWADKTGLPVESYDEDDINQKTDVVFQHVYRAYPIVPSPIYSNGV